MNTKILAFMLSLLVSVGAVMAQDKPRKDDKPPTEKPKKKEPQPDKPQPDKPKKDQPKNDKPKKDNYDVDNGGTVKQKGGGVNPDKEKK